jgi:sarcosine oxidase
VTFDVAVVGLGGLGACVLREVALRGGHVVGVDALDPPHSGGSSHGRTRIIRDAYFEHPLYVPLVRRAREGWRELELEGGLPLLRRTGLLTVGSSEGPVLRGTLRSARTHSIAHRRLSPEEIRKEWPGLVPPEEHEGVYEEEAGVLDPEACIRTALATARRHGAEVRTGSRVLGWEEGPDGVELKFGSAPLLARTLILATGPWLGPLAGEPYASLLQVERQVTFWFGSDDRSAAGPSSGLGKHSSGLDLPVLLWEPSEGPVTYAIPDLGHGLKVARHHGGSRVETRASLVGELDRTVTVRDRQWVRQAAEAFLPGRTGRELDSSVCFYTNTPDDHFLVGRHPAASRVLLLGGGSGHAFKFAPVLAARTADLVPGLASEGRGVQHLWPSEPPSGDGRPWKATSVDPFDPGRFSRSP